jgi:hypothetical protein
MADKRSHTFTFKVEGIALDDRQVRAISDAISSAGAGAMLRLGHPAPKDAVYDWHGIEGIAGGIWALEGVGNADAARVVQVSVGKTTGFGGG